jgi:hypothetical protein
MYTGVLCTHILQSYNFHTFNMFFGKIQLYDDKRIHSDNILSNIMKYIDDYVCTHLMMVNHSQKM